MASVLRNSGVYRNSTIFKKVSSRLRTLTTLKHIGHTKLDVTATFAAIEWESTKMGQALSEGKTKYRKTPLNAVSVLRGSCIDTCCMYMSAVYVLLYMKWNGHVPNKTGALYSSTVYYIWNKNSICIFQSRHYSTNTSFLVASFNIVSFSPVTYWNVKRDLTVHITGM